MRRRFRKRFALKSHVADLDDHRSARQRPATPSSAALRCAPAWACSSVRSAVNLAARSSQDAATIMNIAADFALPPLPVEGVQDALSPLGDGPIFEGQ